MQTRPCWVEISTQSLIHNYRHLKSLPARDVELLAIVKADAYGHSLEICTRALCAEAAAQESARWLGVTSVEEGVAARSISADARVLVIAGVFPGQASQLLEHRLTPVVWESWHLDELGAAAASTGTNPDPVAVHLEIDTGMSRQGVSPAELSHILGRFNSGSALHLEGVMTHLFAADETDRRVTVEQLQRLEAVLQTISAAGLKPEWLNVGNSAALLGGESSAIAELARKYEMKAMMRPGLALYGLAPEFSPQEPAAVSAARASLQPVLSWKTRVVGVRDVPPGTLVGYNGTFVATEPMRLALLAAGYADGLDRRLGNHFSLLVRGERAPLVGRISMDQSVVDVTEIPSVQAGDEVVILGSQGGETITAVDHARVAGTIPWEIFTRIGARVRRIAV
jgi:alanine racemase